MFQVLSPLFFVIFVIIIDRQETQSNYEGAFSDEKYQWGIVGLGTIAHEFAESFNQETSELTAVASRTSEKAENFAHRYNIPKAYGSYQEMLDDAEIDIVYIAVPNRQHIDHILAALEAGKHVLCEKPSR